MSLEYPGDPSFIYAIDFIKGADASVDDLEDEQLFMRGSEFDLEGSDDLMGDGPTPERSMAVSTALSRWCRAPTITASRTINCVSCSSPLPKAPTW